MSIFWLEEKLFSTLPQGQATVTKLHHWYIIGGPWDQCYFPFLQKFHYMNHANAMSKFFNYRKVVVGTGYAMCHLWSPNLIQRSTIVPYLVQNIFTNVQQIEMKLFCLTL